MDDQKHQAGDRGSLYEAAGGAEALLRLTARFYERVKADPLLAPLFSHFTPQHVEHVAIWLGEVFGGPQRFSEELGGHHALLVHHLNLTISAEQRERWVQLMLETAREQLPDLPALQQSFASYIEWGTRIAREISQPGYVLPPVGPIPHWDWDSSAPQDFTNVSHEPSDADEQEFQAQIKPLFRPRDRDAMRWAFDLWSYQAVSKHASAILARLEAGNMPCDGPWQPEQIKIFRDWANKTDRSPGDV